MIYKSLQRKNKNPKHVQNPIENTQMHKQVQTLKKQGNLSKIKNAESVKN